MSRAIRLCPSNKWAYATEAEARRKLGIYAARPDHLHVKGYAPCRAYRCPWCRYWHLTSRGRHSQASGNTARR
jgi:hypothetical protein